MIVIMLSQNTIVRILLIGLIGNLMLISCKKTDDTPPTMSIQSPGDHAEFYVGEVIPVIGSVSHHKAIAFVRILLQNDLQQPVLDPWYSYPGTTTFAIDKDYPIYDTLLETGIYTLVITSSDGENRKNVYRTLRINGINQKFQKALAVCIPNSLNTYVYGIDDGNNSNILYDLPYGYIDSDISSANRQFYFIKPEPSRLFAYNLDEPELDYSIDAGLPYPFISDIEYSEPLVFTAAGNGIITAYDRTGYPNYVTLSSNDSVPYLVHSHYNVVLTYCERRGGPEKYIRQYYRATGVFKTGYQIGVSVIALFSADEETALILWNEYGNSGLYLFDAASNIITFNYNLPSGEIRHAVETGLGTFLISHELGIYEYDHHSGLLSEWYSDLDTETLAFDRTRNVVYSTNGADVKIINYSNKDIISEFTMPYPVKMIHIQYNK